MREKRSAPVGPPRIVEAVEAERLALPFLLAPAPRLDEVVLLGVLASTLEALREVVVLLPTSAPFVHGHDLRVAHV